MSAIALTPPAYVVDHLTRLAFQVERVRQELKGTETTRGLACLLNGKDRQGRPKFFTGFLMSADVTHRQLDAMYVDPALAGTIRRHVGTYDIKKGHLLLLTTVEDVNGYADSTLWFLPHGVCEAELVFPNDLNLAPSPL